MSLAFLEEMPASMTSKEVARRIGMPILTKTPNCKPPDAIPIHKIGDNRKGVVAEIGI